jgi:HEAT repeat protein
MLKDADPRVRASAVFALPRMDQPSVSKEIAPLLEDGDARVRWAAISVLGSLKARTYARDLFRFLEDRDPLLRWNALRVLQSFGEKPGAGEIEKLLAHADAGVRADAVLSVELFQARYLLPDVAKAAADSSPIVRWSAIRVLAKAGDKAYRPDVEKLLEDPDRDVRLAATRAVAALDGRESVPQHPPDGPAAFSRLTSPNPLVHGSYARLVVRALESLDGSAHWSTTLSLGRTSFATGVEDLAAMVSHPQPEVRRSAAWILDQWGSADAIRELQRAAGREQDPGVLKAIQDALSRADKK